MFRVFLGVVISLFLLVSCDGNKTNKTNDSDEALNDQELVDLDSLEDVEQDTISDETQKDDLAEDVLADLEHTDSLSDTVISDDDNLLSEEESDLLLDTEISDADTAPTPCATENEIRFLACGFNGNGTQKQKCVSLQWQDDGDCTGDPDECTNDDTREGPCGLNDNGLIPQLCTNGLWVDNGICIDPDECTNGAWQTQGVDVSECVLGTWVLRRNTKQWGSSVSDRGYSVAVDSDGNIFVTGATSGSLDGNTGAGGWDVFLTKWNADGTKAWTKQWGTTGSDSGESVAVDSTGNIFVTGYTEGLIDGNTNACTANCDTWPKSPSDIFLTKWNADGTKAWTKQWGTANHDEGNSIAVDSMDNLFVSGYTYGSLDGNTNAGSADIFLTKWNANGTKAWTKQWGTTGSDHGKSVTVDGSGNIFVMSGLELFLTKWNADGTKAWTSPWEISGSGQGQSVASDASGNIFIVGSTQDSLDGNISAGGSDIFLIKWNADNTKAWTRQWGTADNDEGYSVAVDSSGNIFVTGYTPGSLDGNTNAGNADIFLTKWNADGTKAWSKQWGTANGDYGRSVAIDASGNIFVTGDTEGSLDGNTSAGSDDLFLTKWLAE